jgi:hypothetical protein
VSVVIWHFDRNLNSIKILPISCSQGHIWHLTHWQICPQNTTYTSKFSKIYTRKWTKSNNPRDIFQRPAAVGCTVKLCTVKPDPYTVWTKKRRSHETSFLFEFYQIWKGAFPLVHRFTALRSPWHLSKRIHLHFLIFPLQFNNSHRNTHICCFNFWF